MSLRTNSMPIRSALGRILRNTSYLWGVLIVALLTPPNALADTIKQTFSGICHPPESYYYKRAKSFTAHTSLEACLESGGRNPKGLQLADADTVDSDNQYERAKFGQGWADIDADCQNSRMEALIAQSTMPIRFATIRKCRIISGKWISPFTGNVIYDPTKIDIDHVVPLKWAWAHGADSWTQEKRERFASDQRNL